MKLFLLGDLARTLEHLHAALLWIAQQVNNARVWVWTRENIENLKTCNDRQASRVRFN